MIPGHRMNDAKTIRPVVWVIENAMNDGLPVYFSPKVARMTGNMHGWTQHIADAAQFASDAEAQLFIDKHLPTMEVNVVRRQM